MDNIDGILHIPWSREELEELIKKIIPTNETNKVEFKRDYDLGNIEHKGEFLKDLSAIANTFDYDYKNHGFIVFGVSQNTITFCTFPNNEDHIQATIDTLVKEYLAPFIKTFLYIFEDKGNKWGVLVIPPSRNAPHIFIKDIHKRYKGDIYVRDGTTTSKASPMDFARFFRQHIEENNYEINYKIRNLQQDISSLSEKLKKLLKKPIVIKEEKTVSEEILPRGNVIEFSNDKSISEFIDETLTKEENHITKGLLNETRKINEFLISSEIAWNSFSTDRDKSHEMVSKIELVCNEYWSSIIKLMKKDDKGIYDDSLVSSINSLSIMWDAPSGISYTEAGKNIRYFPLIITLYLVFIIGVAKKKDKLLKRVLGLKLRTKSHYDEPLPISYSLFFVRSASDLIQPLYEAFPRSKWCDAIASYTNILIDKILTFDDEFIDKEAEFYKGEYVLSLSPLNIYEPVSKVFSLNRPSSGLYLFMPVANPIISKFLKEEKDWLKKVFNRSLEEIFKDFDNIAGKLAYSGGCFGSGFTGGASKIAFPESKI